MAETETDRGETLRLLREEVGSLVKTIPGPVASIALRMADCSLEVTWDNQPRDYQPRRDEPERVEEPIADQEPGTDIVAPLVGTFYVAPEPGAAPFVRVGDHIEAGATIGIVEAMKLMNPVTSTVSGEVVEVAVADGEPVEFGQPLVRLRETRS